MRILGAVALIPIIIMGMLYISTVLGLGTCLLTPACEVPSDFNIIDNIIAQMPNHQRH